jgi:tRNA nucleotidyltransferase (CCA-adding enzyme)
MALDEAGALIDPFGGRADLEAGVLRHVGAAFAEDPVRILRTARFAARFAGFTVADETMRLMRTMTEAGEVDALVAERVWQELARLLPEVDRLWGVPQRADVHPEVDTGAHLMLVLDAAARLDASLPARWAAVLHDLGKATTPKDDWPRHPGHEERSVELARAVNERLRVPNDCREASILAAREHGNVHCALQLDAAALLRLLERCDALRRPALLAQVLDACEADARGRTGHADDPYPQRRRLLDALDAARGVDAGAIAARAGPDGAAIAQAVHRARVEAVAARLSR